MANYGSHPEDILQYIGDSSESSTISSEILLNLGKAYKLTLELEEAQQGSTFLQGKQLIINTIEKAWREALYVRASLPANLLETPEGSPISISRMGVISENEEEDRIQGRGCSVGVDDRPKTSERVPKNHRGTRRYKRNVSRGSH